MSAQPQWNQMAPTPVAVPNAAGLATVPLANAATVVGVIAYLICAAVAIVAPDALLGFFQPWFHGLTLDPLRPAGPWFQPGQALLGLVTFGVSVWLWVAATAALYNTFVRTRR